MPRPLLDLWRCWIHIPLLLTLLLFEAVFMLLVAPGLKPLVLGLFALIVVGGVVRCSLTPPLWVRLSTRVWSFCSTSGSGVRLHYPSSLRPQVEKTHVLEACEQNLIELASLFGFSLRRRLVVFLFRSRKYISRICGRKCGGTALVKAGAVLIAFDEEWARIFRHEVAHLLSLRLGPP